MNRVLAGTLTGVFAGAAMDATLRLLRNASSPRVQRREDSARKRIPAMEVLAQRLARGAGRSLSARQRQRGGRILQGVMAVAGGLIYAALRDRLPLSGLRRGLLYGAGFSLVVDEGLTPLAGLSPGPGAFPWQTHGRGFVGHLAFGAAAELAMHRLSTSAREAHDAA